MLPLRNTFLAVGLISGILWMCTSISQHRYSIPLFNLSSSPTDKDMDVIGNNQVVFRNDTLTSTLVVPSLKAKYPAWLKQVTWMDKKIYTVDDPTSWLKVPENKGNEAMVYLTYIIDHYDKLNDVTVFSHPDRYQWHNDDPDYDALRILQRLNLTYVLQEGYANLRCAWLIGCQAEIWPRREAEAYEKYHKNDPDYELRTGDVFKEIWEELIPEMPVPETVGVACCAQFAVSAEAIRRRPREDYIRYRQWLLETEDDDDISGRIFEYLWHVIFGKTSVFCPIAGDCYCKLYGLCNLKCEDDDGCNEQYVFPKHIRMPEAWPQKDWDGKRREPGTIWWSNEKDKQSSKKWRDMRILWLPGYKSKHTGVQHQKRKGVPAGGKKAGGRGGRGR